MILTRQEIEPQMGGLAIPVIQRVLLTTILINKVSSEPLILTGIYLARQSQTSCLTLQIRFETQQSLTQELLMSSSTAKLPLVNPYGVGSLIKESILIGIIAMSLLLKKAMQTARSLISR